MKGLPKRFATADDIRNCYALVQSGEIERADLLEAMEELERQNYICCPIREISSDFKTVTVGYCAEASEGSEAIVGNRAVTIESINHIPGEAQEGMDAGFEKTEIELSAEVAADAICIDVTAPYNIYDQLGITKAEFDEIKAALAN